MISLKFSFPKAFYRFALFFLYSFPFISLIPAYRRFLQQMPIYTSIYFCMYTFYIYVEVWKEAFHFWDYRSCASFPERDENAGRQTASQRLFESLASLFPFLLSSRMQFLSISNGTRQAREYLVFKCTIGPTTMTMRIRRKRMMTRFNVVPRETSEKG